MPAKPSTPKQAPPPSAQDYQAAADKYLRQVMARPDGPRDELVKIGIYTKSGKLSKNYR